MSKSAITRIPTKALQVPVQLKLKHLIIVRIDMTDITKLHDNEKKKLTLLLLSLLL